MSQRYRENNSKKVLFHDISGSNAKLFFTRLRLRQFCAVDDDGDGLCTSDGDCRQWQRRHIITNCGAGRGVPRCLGA